MEPLPSCLGQDEPMSLKGMHNHWAFMDEVAQMHPDTWIEAVYPTLQANNGKAIFIGTPKGANFFYDLAQMEKHENPKVAAEWKTIYIDANISGVFTPEELEIKRATMGEAATGKSICLTGMPLLQEPIMVSSSMNYIKQDFINEDIQYDPNKPVITAWDLGINDPTSIWFVQRDGDFFNVIDFYENSDIANIQHYIDVVKAKGYSYEYHIYHDVDKRHLSSASTIKQLLIKSRLE